MENEKTKLTLKHGGVTMTWEGPWDADLSDIMSGLVGCLRGVTFGDWVVEGIRDWAEEQLPEDETSKGD